MNKQKRNFIYNKSIPDTLFNLVGSFSFFVSVIGITLSKSKCFRFFLRPFDCTADIETICSSSSGAACTFDKASKSDALYNKATINKVNNLIRNVRIRDKCIQLTFSFFFFFSTIFSNFFRCCLDNIRKFFSLNFLIFVVLFDDGKTRALLESSAPYSFTGKSTKI